MYWNYEVLDAGTKDFEIDIRELSSTHNHHFSAPSLQLKISSTGFRPTHKLPSGTAWGKKFDNYETLKQFCRLGATPNA